MRLLPLRRLSYVAAIVAAASLAACDKGDQADESAKSVAVELKKSADSAANSSDVEGVTPMAERVAELGLLNKRNGLVQLLTMKPGEQQRIGNAIIRLQACEQTAPWETYPETGAFVQLVVYQPSDEKWYRTFSGWIFRERPERNVIEHPIYDVFVKSCAMTYPGGEAVALPSSSAATSASSAPQSAAANGGEGGENGTAAPAAPPASPAASANSTPAAATPSAPAASATPATSSAESAE